MNAFNAVFYAEPVPSSWSTLTYLALLFDKVYFPGVHIPETGIDIAATKEEIRRLRALDRRDIETVQMLNCMVYALNARSLKRVDTERKASFVCPPRSAMHRRRRA